MRAHLPFLALLVLLTGCHGTLELIGVDFGAADDDDVVGDDDDATGDDDDATGDDDDATGDDDDATGDDDDATGDDDDATGDDDDAVDPCLSIPATCATTLTGDNGAQGTNNMDWYDCVGGGLTGPEVLYVYTAGADEELHVTLSGLTQDLDLYVLEGDQCDVEACLEGSWNSGSDQESVRVDLAAGDIVTIVVDGWDGAESGYTLELSCDGSGDDDDDDDDDDDSVGVDADNDGSSTPADCNDADPSVHPGAPEACDTVDNDCDGSVDDGACQGCTQGAYNGHTYQLCNGLPLNWNDANTACQAFGYYLVTINAAAENTWLGSAAPGPTSRWWIGFTDAGGWQSEGNWYWSAGNGSGYTNWNPGEPNNSGNEDCAEMVSTSSFRWNDIGCGTQQAFVCEGDF